MTHPFVERVRFERLVVVTVNGAMPLDARQLSGLGRTEIEKWSEYLAGTFSELRVTRIRRALIDLAMRIRSSSSNSHRGGDWSTDEDLDHIHTDLVSLKSLFAHGKLS